ncbi:MAG: S8 family peptidase [Myxococcales bacterium]|nr:S8 family peptidase [Myxococcota bacterium]MDW8280426.1 S8 family peptidase [Myxococcales bacterium]
MRTALLSLLSVLVAAPARAQAPPPSADVPAEAPALEGELVVDLNDRLTDAQVAELGRRYDVQILPVSSYSHRHRIYRMQVRAAAADRRALVARILAALRRDRAVEAADPALIYQIPETAPGSLTRDEPVGLPARVEGAERGFPNDPKYKYQWHLDQIRMPRAWPQAQGQGVIVAVVDTGVTQVEDLRGTEMVPGWNFIDNTADARDDHGHGTHVAGTIAQTTHNGIGVAGVAYKARIMPIKVLSAQGSGSVAAIAEGVRWAVDHGAQVINMSLGGRLYSQVLAAAVQYAYDRGVVVVCAAGNDGRGKVSYPAANRGAIAVAATQFDETTTFYSNWGREISVAAPGGNTRLDQNGDGLPDGVLQNTVVPGDPSRQDYLLFMGTSMAAPHVAGVAALIIGAGVKDPAQVRRILERSARRPNQLKATRDDHYGYGIVDAEAAVRAAQAATQDRGEGSLALSLGLLLLGGVAMRRASRASLHPL